MQVVALTPARRCHCCPAAMPCASARGEMLAAGRSAGQLCDTSRLHLDRLDATADFVAKVIARELSDAGSAAACALAAFQTGRQRPLGADRRQGDMGGPGGAVRARPSISPSCRCCSMPAPGRTGAIATARPACRSAAPKGWRWRAFACSRPVRFPTMPKEPLRADAERLAAFTADDLAQGFSGQRGQSADAGWKAGRH